MWVAIPFLPALKRWGLSWLQGQGKKNNHPTAHPTLRLSHTHAHTSMHTYVYSIYIYISPSFSHPGSADVTSGTMNLTYGSGDSYLGCGKSVRRRREEKEHEPRRLMAAPAQRPWNWKKAGIHCKTGIFHPLVYHWGCSFAPFWVVIRLPFLWRDGEKSRKQPDWRDWRRRNKDDLLKGCLCFFSFFSPLLSPCQWH